MAEKANENVIELVDYCEGTIAAVERITFASGNVGYAVTLDTGEQFKAAHQMFAIEPQPGLYASHGRFADTFFRSKQTGQIQRRIGRQVICIMTADVAKSLPTV